MPRTAAVQVPIERLRAAWLARQGLLRPEADTIAAVRRGGWLMAAGGQGPYLALRARCPGLARAEIDRAVIDEGLLLELPALRGSAMLVPADDAALALRAARPSVTEREAKIRAACDLSARELEGLAEAVVTALSAGALGVEGLREAVPARLVRSLGEAGKKLGDATTLTVALRRLMIEGRVRRASVGRIDSGRYAYARSEAAVAALLPDPPIAPIAPIEGEDLAVELGRRFFAWAGPATRAELAFWAGITQALAKAVMARLGLVRVAVEGVGDELWIPESEAATLAAIPAPPEGVTMLPFRDNFTAHRRSLRALVVAEDLDTEIAGWASERGRLGDASSLHHHTILVGGRVAGIWDFDRKAGRVAWGPLGELGRREARAIEAEAERLATFIREELGDVRFYALDSEKNRAARLAAVRALRA